MATRKPQERPDRPTNDEGAPVSTAADPPAVDELPIIKEVGGRQVLTATRTRAHPYHKAYCTMCKKWFPNDHFEVNPQKPGMPRPVCLLHGVTNPITAEAAASQEAGLLDGGGALAQAQADRARVDELVATMRSALTADEPNEQTIDAAFAQMEAELVLSLFRRALSGDLPAMRMALERAQRGRRFADRASAAASGVVAEPTAETLGSQEDWARLQQDDVGPAGPAAKPHDLPLEA